MDYDFMEGQALVIGTGCMPNCNWALINAREGKPSYNHAGLHRSVDPGISGFTGYHNQKMFTVRSVPAGGELFVSYGEQWFTDREEDIGAIPFIGSYDNVDKFLKKFKKVSLKHHTAAGDSNFTRDLWDVIKSIPYETRNVNALPLSFEDLQLAQHIGSAESRLPYSVRTLDWLKEHGRCMDNIRPGISTIKQAGRGAFASRFIPEGGLVAPGPLLHIANRTALNIYEMGHTGNRDPSNQIGMQLVLNYCFGNKQSTVILCPYTSPSAYINHSSESPNVKVVWSKDSTPNHNPGWLEENVKFLKNNDYIGLSIDYIATREIQPGEEVFLDYGPEWDEAWNDYMKKWTPPPDSDEYVPAASLEEPYRTEEEELLKPYSDNIVFYCAYGYEQGMPEGVYNWVDEWYELFAPYPCEIESREARGVDSDGNTMYYYEVVMLDESEIIEGMVIKTAVIPEGEEHTMINVPGYAIDVRDRQYTKDEFIDNAFRHEMIMPDDIFPDDWKNLK